MGTRRPLLPAFAGLLGLAVAVPPGVASAQEAVPPPPDLVVCDDDPGDPAPGTEAWRERDRRNLLCATQRQQDNLANPSFMAVWAMENARVTAERAPQTALEVLTEPNRPRLNPVYPMGPARVTDPFRNPDDWAEAGRGRHTRLRFVASTGAHLVARVYAPPESAGPGPYPGIAFSPGLQSYNEVNSWFGQGLAEEGYVVVVIDPQGQGDSESCGHTPTGETTSCTGQDDIRSMVTFLLSTPDDPVPGSESPNGQGTAPYNPYWELIDRSVGAGVGGHSNGAIRGVPAGQADPRVAAIVSYDNLDGTLGASTPRRAPTLAFYVDYAFPLTLTPRESAPNARQHFGIFNQLDAAGVDVMTVTTRASTHYEWGYQPFPASFPASRYGERVSFHYTLAWFDRYLKGDEAAVGRLTSGRFDGSADRSSIGAGTYDPSAALADPADPRAGNVPYRIGGKCVANLLSFYFDSAYSLEGGSVRDLDMRASGCPDGTPSPAETTVEVTGATSGEVGETVRLAARLTDETGPVEGAVLGLSLRGEEHEAVTGPDGVGAVDVVVPGPAGETPLTVTFPGDDGRAASSATVPFTVERAASAIGFSSARGERGTWVVSVDLTGGSSGAPLAGRTVVLEIADAGSWALTTGSDGRASVDVGRPRQWATVSVRFDGDDGHRPAGATGTWHTGSGAAGSGESSPVQGTPIAAQGPGATAPLGLLPAAAALLAGLALAARRRSIAGFFGDLPGRDVPG